MNQGQQPVHPGQVTMIRLPMQPGENQGNRIIMTSKPVTSPSKIVVPVKQRQIVQKVTQPVLAPNNQHPNTNQSVQYVRLVTSTADRSQSHAAGDSATVLTTDPTRKVALIPTSTQPQIVSHINSSNTIQPQQRVILPAASPNQTITFPGNSNINRIRSQLPQGTTILQTTGNNGGQYVALLPNNLTYKVQQQPANPVQQVHNQSVQNNLTPLTIHKIASTPKPPPSQITPPSARPPSESSPPDSENKSGPKQRKPCNCTKSQCLKLYCDCFANGEFCQNCNCNNCANNLENEEQRQKAIKQCLERNPQAFHPKIGKGESAAIRRHQKGCNCKRSGCLKNYCECYEAKIACGSMCKCVGCKNCGDDNERKSLMHLADAAMVKTMQQNAAKSRLSSQFRSLSTADEDDSLRDSLKAHLQTNVIEAIVDCMIVRCREAEVAKCKDDTTEKLVYEEFGRCLRKIIDQSQSDTS